MSNAAIQGYVERLERLEAEKQNALDDIKVLKQEIKSEGFDVKTVAKLVKIRKNVQKAKEEAQLLQVYCAAVQLELL